MTWSKIFFVLDSSKPDHAAQVTLRSVGSLIAIFAAIMQRWLADYVVPRTVTHFQEAIGDRYLEKLPKLTVFVLEFFESVAAMTLEFTMPHVALALIWLLRPVWSAGLLTVLLFVWTVSLGTVTMWGLWFGDQMILRAIEAGAKARGLI